MFGFSGKFVLRLPSELHRRLARNAEKLGVSLNQYCLDRLSENSREGKVEPFWRKEIRKLLPILKKKFRAELLAVLLFGSRVSGQFTSESDLDVLIVLDSNIPIQRKLYTWWDENLPSPSSLEISPHFVHLPKEVPSGLWFEIALNHDLIYQRGREVAKALSRLLSLIESGQVVRHWSHGHPYWVWRESREKQILNG